MSSPRDEQQAEVEALAAIYGDDFVVVQSEPLFLLSISLRQSDDYHVDLQLTLPPAYPTDPLAELEIGITSLARGMSKKDEVDLREFLKQQIAVLGLAGSPMIFTLVSELLPWLANLEEHKLALSELQQREEAEALATIKRQKEEEERRLSEMSRYDDDTANSLSKGGTPVTVASFAVWKSAFDAEMEAKIAAADPAVLSAAAGRKRLTGREVFELFGGANAAGVGASAAGAEDGAEELDMAALAEELDRMDNDQLDDEASEGSADPSPGELDEEPE